MVLIVLKHTSIITYIRTYYIIIFGYLSSIVEDKDEKVKELTITDKI